MSTAKNNRMKTTLLAIAIFALALLFGFTSISAEPFNTAYAEGNVVAVTFDGSTTEYPSFEQAWSYVVGLSTTNTKRATVKLLADWTATPHETAVTSFGSGKGFGDSVWDQYGSIAVPNDKFITLDLNGKTINRALTAEANNGSVIIVNGNLTLVDTSESQNGTIKGGYADGAGGGVLVYGTLVMNGGSISGNSASSSGGGLYAYGNFTMNGGNISNNNANNGGGASISGNFTMKAGSISGNNATNGGGIYLTQVFTMSGGSISNNTVTTNGGGVYVENFVSGIQFYLCGDAEIIGNKKNDTANNVYLKADNVINISDNNDSTSHDSFSGTVGVSTEGTPTESTPVYITNGWGYSTGSVLRDNTTYLLNKISSEYAFSLAFATVTFDADKEGDNEPITTEYASFVEAWGVASQYETTADYRATVKLLFDVTAVNGCFTPSVGTYYGFGTGSLSIYEDTYIVLDLNGKTVNRGLNAPTNFGQVIMVLGDFTLIDSSVSQTGTVTGGYASVDVMDGNGGGVYVDDTGKFTMEGGKIVGNIAEGDGGGIYVYNTFVMNGGTISGNTSEKYGGGVFCAFGYPKATTFTMTDGIISGNTSVCGGGAYIENFGTFTMSGGTINGNNATVNGGGLFLAGIFNSSNDVNVTENFQAGTLESGVYVQGSGSPNNVYLFSGKVINISDNDASTSNDVFSGNIGVTLAEAPTSFDGTAVTKDFGSSTGTITSDNPIYSSQVNSSGERAISIYLASFTNNIGVETLCTTIAEAWNEAVQLVTTSENRVTVKLFDNWTADATHSFGSGLGFGYTQGESGTGNIFVPADKYITLDLNGYTINRNLSSAIAEGYVIRVLGDLILIDSGTNGTITGGNSSSDGGGVYVATKTIAGNDYCGSFKMEDGNISGNNANDYYGGGVYVDGVYEGIHGTFTMTGGSISNNQARYGSGVYLHYETVFTMSGGTISGNTAEYSGGGVYVSNATFEMSNTATISCNASTMYAGGGLYVSSQSVVTMNGGTISGNNSLYGEGGGIYCLTQLLAINGGTIIGNNARDGGGGIYLSVGPLMISGAVIIKDNYCNGTLEGDKYVKGSGSNDNLRLLVNAKIGISGAFTAPGIISLSSEYMGVFTSGWTDGCTGTLELEDSTLCIGVDGSEKSIVYPTVTVQIGDSAIINYAEFAEAWNYAVGLSTTDSNRATVQLFADKTAVSGSFGTGIGFGDGTVDGTGYILVPINKYITLNLNGKTINRAVGETAIENGYVIKVNGNLTLTDSATGGKIIGGNNSGDGGAVCISASATFTMMGGTISGNTAENGGGVFVFNGATFTAQDGTIEGNNANNNGGGVYLKYEATFNLRNGTDITENVKGGTKEDSSTIYTGGTANNVYLSTAQTVSTNAFIGSIGVTTETIPTASSPVIVTSGWGSSTGTIVSDNTAYLAYETSDEIALSPPLVSVLFDANGDGDTDDDGEVKDYIYFNEAWNYAVGLSTTDTNRATVKLFANQTAVGGSFGTGMGFGDGTATGTGYILVPSGEYITLDLNGNTINRNVGATAIVDGYVIKVVGNLTLTDSGTGGTITGGNTTENGGGIYIGGGTFTMQGGTITGNTAKFGGGGIMMTYDAIFEMNDGKISVNTANFGGGIYASGMFTMSGGTISGNVASRGSAVYVGYYTIIKGGTISGNTANSSFGAIYVGGNLFLSGNANVMGNYYNGTFNAELGIYELGSGTLCNVYLPKDELITINDNDDTTSDDTFIGSIGLVTSTKPTLGTAVVVTSGWGSSTGTIVSDDTSYFVHMPDSEQAIAVAVASVTFDSNGDGDTTDNGEVTKFADFAQAWNYAVGLTTSDSNRAMVKLLANWTADSTIAHSFGTGIGFGDGTYTDTGNIFVPTGKYITLDLNGNKINRAVGDEPISQGYVIGVDGNLTIIDSSESKTGTIEGGNTSYRGGGVVVLGDGTFTMTDGTISNNNSENDGGGVLLFADSTFIMTGGKICHNNANTNGGGVFVDSNSQFIMSGGEIEYNNANTNGGGVFQNSICEFTMSGGSIHSNYAIVWAGGVYTIGKFNLSGNSSISDNFYSNDKMNNLSIDDGTMITISDGNSTPGESTDTFSGTIGFSQKTILFGASYTITSNWGSSTGTILSDNPYYSIIEYNSEKEILVLPVASVTYNDLTKNYETFEEAWIYALGLSTTSDKNATVKLFKDVTAVGGSFGTGIGFGDGTDAGTGYILVPVGKYITLDLNGKTINRAVGATAIEKGYVIGVSGSFTLTDSATGGTITGGNTTENGGGIYIGGGTFTMKGGTIEGNTAIGIGGGVYAKNAYIDISAGIICDNNAVKGGGVYLDTCTFTMSGGSISNNRASNDGGGLYVSISQATISGGTVNGNSAYNGGGFYLAGGSSVTMSDNTIARNSVIGNGGGIYSNADVFTMQNSTVNGNNAGNGGGVFINTVLTMISGTISGNNAGNGGGVYVFANPFNLSGNAYITDNFVNGTLNDTSGLYEVGSGKLCNIYLVMNKLITISDDDPATPNDTFNGSVGVSTAFSPTSDSPITITNLWGDSTGTITSDNTNFVIPVLSTLEKALSMPLFTVTIDLNDDGDTDDIGEITNYADFENAWNYAVGLSTTDSNRATVKLLKDVTAVGGSLGTGVGFGDGTSSGVNFILVPSYKYIILDLNGKTINRDLMLSTADGYSIKVDGHLTLTDSATGGTITGGNNGGYGGAISISTNGTFIMEGGSISGNRAGYYGGAVFVGGGTFTMSGGSIVGNSATNGGAVRVTDSATFTMLAGIISNNTATDYGGGIHVYDSTFTMIGGTISNNTAINYGGGIYASEGIFEMSGGTISDNTANYNGGGMYVNQSDIEITGGTISDNTANYNGGGLYCNGGCSVEMSVGTIEDNYAANNGGGVYTDGGSFNMTSGTIRNNRSDYQGGGLYLKSTTVTISNPVSISGNSAKNNGGGVYLSYSSTLTVKGGSITGNATLQYGGGGVYLDSYSTLNVCGNSIITDNVREATLVEGVLSGGNPNNVYLNSSGLINISDNNETTSNDTFTGSIGVSTYDTPSSDSPVTVTNGWGNSTGAITSDKDIYGIYTTADSERAVALPIVTVTFDANGDGDTTDSGEVKNYADFEDVWNYAVGLSTTDSNRATVQLLVDWIANSDSFGTGIGFGDGTATGTGYILVPAGKFITIDLNNKKINRGLSGAIANGQVINVLGNLVLDDTSYEKTGKITGGYSSTDGGGVYSNGTFTMNGGTISGNKSTVNGGGVYSNGTFTMNGGSIIDNNASSDGGGIYLASGTFTMSDSVSISYNSSEREAGGVAVYGATFTMLGGSISNNTADGNGGGVRVFGSGILNFCGNGTVVGNVKGGTISGGILSGGNANNVYLYNLKLITISDNNIETSNDTFIGNIGVTTKQIPTIENPVTVTSGWGSSTGTVFSDDTDIILFETSANEKALSPPVASVTFEETTTRYATFEDAWSSASEKTSTESSRAKVTLLRNVTASDDDEKSFGSKYGFMGNKVILVPSIRYITLDLNGYVIDRNVGDTAMALGYVIRVEGNLLLVDSSPDADGAITGGNSEHDCGGVVVFTGAMFTMNQGAIRGNKTQACGGGVYVYGTFIMNGGTIEGNTVQNSGGGVYIVAADANFIMNGGSIIGNNALVDGGGVCAVNGSFTMTDGTIQGNNASQNGGGVSCFGTFNISGNVTIVNNVENGERLEGFTDYTGGIPSNVYLFTDKFLTISDNDEGTENDSFNGNIGVKVASLPSLDNPITLAIGWGSSDGTISSDNALYRIVVDSIKNEVLLSASVTVTYKANYIGGTADINQTFPFREESNLASNTFVRPGYKFVGWAIEQEGANAYDNAQSLILEDDLTLYALWKEKTAVTVPINAGSKAYTGTTLVSDLPATEYYTITTNEGGITVADYDVVLTLLDNTNYKWATGEDTATRTIKFSITQATNAFTTALAISNWIYGESAKEPNSTATFGTPVYTYSNTENGTYNSSVPSTSGNYWVKATVAETTNYTGLESKVAFVIRRVDVTVPINAGSKVYSGTTLVSDLSATEYYTITTNEGGINAGEYDVVLTLTDSVNYKWATGEDTAIRTIKFSITQATNLFTTQVAIVGWIKGDSANEPSSTAKFGTPVYSYSNSENGTYNSTVPQESGMYWVKASVAATESYTSAESKAQFEIRQKTVVDSTNTVVITAAVGIYHDITVTVIDNITPSGKISETSFTGLQKFDISLLKNSASVDTSDGLTSIGVDGSVSVKVKLNSAFVRDGNLVYDTLKAIYVKSDSTLEEIAVTSTEIVDGVAYATFDVTHFSVYEIVAVKTQLDKPAINGNTFTYSGADQSYKTADSYDSVNIGVVGNTQKNAIVNKSVTFSLNDKDNFEWKDGTQSDVIFSWTVNKQTLTPTVSNVSGKIYDGNVTATGTIALSGAVNDENPTASGIFKWTSANALTTTCNVSEIALGGDWTTNYELSVSTLSNVSFGSAKISKADSSFSTAPSAKTLTYSGEAQALVNAGSAIGGNVWYKLDGGVYSTDIPSATNANVTGYTVYYKIAGDNNHNDLAEASLVVSIAKATLTVKASSHNITYGDEAPSYTVSYKGFVNGETQAVLETKPTATSTYTTTTAVSSSPLAISASGGVDDNYRFSYTNGNLTINRKSIDGATVTLGATLVYNGNTQTQTIASVMIDGLSATYSIANNSQTNHSESGYTLTVNGIGNFTGSVTKTWNIDKITLTPSVASISGKYYDGNTTANGIIALSGAVNDEVPTATATFVWTDKNAETTTVNVSNIALNNAWNTNYNLAVNALNGKTYSTAKISKLQLTLSGTAITAKDYDGNVTATAVLGTVSGVVGSEDVTVTASGEFENANAGTEKAVLVSYALSGVDSANYIAPANDTLTGVINKINYVMTAVAWNYSQAFTYDKTEKSVTVTNLPTGLTVNNYTNNAKTDAGNYTASVTFNYDAVNYNMPSLADCDWVINQANNSFTTAVAIMGWTYGESAKEPNSTATFGTPSYTYSNSEDGTYNTTIPTTAGTYWVKATVAETTNYLSAESKISFAIATQKVTKPIANDTVFTYTGAEQTYAITVDSRYTITNDKRTNAGSQTVTVALNDKTNYEWATSGTNDLTFTFAIATQKVTKPIANDTVFTYIGTEQTYVITLNDAYTVSNDKRTNAGSQTVTVALNDKTNYEWATGGTENLTFTFAIATQKVTAPTADDTVFTYNGEEQTYAITADERYTITNNKCTNAGSQTVTVALNDKTNYEWATGGTENLTFTFAIATQKVTAPTANDTVFTYTGAEQTYAITVDSRYTITNDKRTNAGSQTVTVALKDKDNYEWATSGTDDLTFTFAIATQKVTAPTADDTVFTYTEAEQTYAITADERYTITNDKRTNAGSQTVTVALKDKDNYEWATGGTENLTFTFAIATQKVTAPTANDTVFTYTGAEQTYAITVDSRYTITNDKRTDAGEQTVTVALNDKTNYKWATGGTENLTFTFAIATQKVTKPTADDTVFTYNGAEQTYVLILNDAYTVSNDKRTNAGEQTVTVALNDKDNYEWATSGTNDLAFVFVIEQKEATLLWAAIDDLVYSKTAKMATATVSNLETEDVCDVIVELSTGNDNVNVGSFTNTAIELTNSNYKLPANVTSGSYAITAREITVRADAKTSAQDVDLVGLTYTVSPELCDGDSFSGALATTANNEIVAEYDITQGTLSAGSNYVITFVSAKYVITEKAFVSITQTAQNYEYDGTAKSFAILGTELSGFAVQYYVNDAYVESAPTNAGSYKVKVTRDEDVKNYAFSVEISNGLVIDAQKVTVPTADDTIFTYNTAEQSYTLTADSRYTITNDKRTNAGSQTVTVALNEKVNYEWSTGGTDDLTFTFVIDAQKVTVPTADDTIFTYNTSEQSYTLTADSRYTITNDKRIDAGSQTVTVALNEKVNYEWSTGGTDDLTFTFVIETQKITEPTANDTVFTYNSTEQIYSLTADSRYTITGDRRINAGSQSVTVALNDKDNYEWTAGGTVDLSFTFAIATQKVDKPTENAMSFTYNGEEQSYNLHTNSRYTITGNKRTDAGSQSVTVALNDKDNYEWTAGGTDDLTFIFAIARQKIDKPTENTTTFTYSGEEQTYVLATDSRYTITGEKRTDAGEQVVTVTLNSTVNYEWTTGGTDSLTFNFAIGQAQAIIDVSQTPIVKTYAEIWTLPTATANFGTVYCDKTSADLTNANSYVVTYSVETTDNYLGDVKTVNVTIKKQRVTKPTADSTVFIADGTSKTYTIATDSRYTVSGNVKTDVGNHAVTVALNDIANYEWVDGTTVNLNFDFIIRQAQLGEKTEDVDNQNKVIVTAENGFVPGVTVQITAGEQVEGISLAESVSENEEVVIVYNVKLLLNQAEIQPEGEITIRILIPAECNGKTFRLLHVHGDSVTEMPYTIDGAYVVVITDNLSEFVFVVDQDAVSLVWLIVVFAIFIVAEAVLAVLKLRKNKQNKGTVKTYSFMPLILAAVIPSGQIGAVIALGVIFALGGLFNVYLYFIKDKSKKQVEVTYKEKQIPSEEVEINTSKEVAQAESDTAKELPQTESDTAKEVAQAESDIINELPQTESDTAKEVALAESDTAKELPQTESDIINELPQTESDTVKEVAQAESDIINELPQNEDTAKEVAQAESDTANELPQTESDIINELQQTESVCTSKESVVKLPQTTKEYDSEKVTDETESIEEEINGTEEEVVKDIERETGLVVLARYRKSFMAKLIQSSDGTKEHYGALKNDLLSYNKTTSRISWNYDSINSGRKHLAKFSVRGKTLYLYFALNPEDFAGTKYKVERTKSKKYESTPCLYRIRNGRRAKYALELIALLAEKQGLQKGEGKTEDYYLPFESTEALIAKDLIKEIISKEKYEDYVLRQQRTNGDVQQPTSEGVEQRDSVSESDVDKAMQDEVAAALIIKKQGAVNGKKVKALVNIDSISNKFASGETVNLDTLKAKGLLHASVTYYKILARGTLNKALTVEANELSIKAVKMILLTGGKVIKLL